MKRTPPQNSNVINNSYNKTHNNMHENKYNNKSRICRIKVIE
ncbi:MAG: hypothetical protein WCL48_08440 [Betaproteobacteria bacterium]